MDNNEIASEALTLLLVFVHGGVTTATRDIARKYRYFGGIVTLNRSDISGSAGVRS